MKYFFSHDFSARNNPDIVKIRIKFGGMRGYGLYFGILEVLCENDGVLNLSEIECLAFDLREPIADVEWVVFESGLFVIEGEKFFSKSLLERLKFRDDVIEKRRAAGRASAEKRKQKRQQVLNTCSTSVEEKSNKIEQTKQNKTKQNKKREEKHASEKLKKLSTEFSRVQKMKNPLTEEQFDLLVYDFGGSVVAEILSAMENKLDLLKKYTSANLTVRSWLSRDNFFPRSKLEKISANGLAIKLKECNKKQAQMIQNLISKK